MPRLEILDTASWLRATGASAFFAAAAFGLWRGALGAIFIVVVTGLLSACRGDKASGTSHDTDSDDESPVTVDATEFTYQIAEGGSLLTVWTTPATHRLRTNERPPDAVHSGIVVHAARNEFEPVALVLGPGEGRFRVAVDPFPTLSGAQRVEVNQVGYVDGVAETLTPISDASDILLTEDFGVPIWLTIYVPKDATAGEHDTVIRVFRGEDRIDIPLTLYVFDFALPDAIHFATQLNISMESLVGAGSVEAAKSLLFEHRMTPKSVTWPSGFNWEITWENSGADAPCEAFWDEPDAGADYSIGTLAPKYILGEGWNAVGFPNAMVFQFVDNSTPRPASLCGIERGDHFGSDAYNREWSDFLGSLEAYLDGHGMLDKAYYYVQNEPQDDDDYRLAAHLCRLTRAAAPDLRIAISEEPKPEIAEDPAGPCGYDIWIAHVRAYNQTYAWQRQRAHGERVWLYSLDADPDPYFNPTRADADGMHQRIIPWVAWTLRVDGWAYYDAGRFFDDGVPAVRAELLREGFEDYEYLYLAAGGARPEVDVENGVDETARSVASGLTAWIRDADALMALRRELGFFVEGTRETPPVLETEGTDVRPRDTYRINFQDPLGPPEAEPLVIDGDTYLKVGWAPYDDAVGYGWFGEYVEDAGIALYGYDDLAGYSEAEKSYLYDDYGRDNLFEFALANGTYDVTVGAGRPARGYDDPHNVTIEGAPAIAERTTSDANPIIAETVRIELTDGYLSMEMGGRSETTGEWAYTFVAYLIIAPV